MNLRLLSLVAGAALAVQGSAALAHHSFAAEFDANKPVKLEGVVTKMDWINPHSWIHLEVTDAKGAKQEWMIEGGAPNALLRRGWNRNSLPAGTKVKVTGSPAKDGAKRLNSQNLEFPDGRKMSLGGSNPNEGQDRK